MSKTPDDLEGRRLRAALGKKLFGAAPSAEVTLDRYVLLEPLGRGGMATVYRARDPKLGRTVAVKLVEDGGLSQQAQHERRQRTIREARALAALSHPNIIEILDVGQVERGVFLAMELIAGGSLLDWLQTRDPTSPQHVETTVGLIEQAIVGVAAAHAAGIVHRDVKPSNLLRGADGRVRVADFGLARTYQGPSTNERSVESRPSSIVDASSDSLTATGTILGTPAYMAPEQLRGQLADVRSDVFALCASAFELLTGERPFQGRSSYELLDRIEQGDVHEAERLPTRLRAVLLRGMAADPEDRHPSADVLLREFKEASAPRRGLLWTAVATATVAGLVGWSAMSPTDNRLERCLERTQRPSALEGREDVVKGWFETALGEAAGPVVFERAQAQLQTRAEEWSAAVEQTCRATWSEDAASRGTASGSQLDPALLCLERERDRSIRFIDSLEGEPSTVLVSVPKVVLAWPAPERCLDANTQIPAGLEADAAQRWASEVAQLEHATTLKGLGKFEEASKTVDAVRREADSLNAPRLHARAILLAAQIELESGSPKKALALADDAMVTAIASADDETAGRAMVELGRVQAEEFGAPDEAATWFDRAEAALNRAKASPRLLRMVNYNRATAIAYSDRFEEARAAFQTLYKELATAQDVLPIERSQVLGALSQMELGLGNYDTATKLTLEVIELDKQITGGRGGDAATSWCVLSELQFRQGDYPSSLKTAQTCYEIHLGSAGPGSLAASEGLQALSIVHRQLGNDEQALDYAKRAQAITAKELGTEAPRYVAQSLDVVNSLSEMGRHDEALAELVPLATSAKQVWGEVSPGYAVVVAIRARIEHRLGRLEDSVRDYETAIELRKELFDPRNPEVGKSKLMLARVVLAQKRYADAANLLKSSLSITRESLPPGHVLIINALDVLSQCQIELGEKGDARRNLSEAIGHLETELATSSDDEVQAQLDELNARLAAL